MSKRRKREAAGPAEPAEDGAVSSDEREALSTEPAPEVFEPEDQAQRWTKYGVNVLLTSVIVIVLAAIMVWAAQGTQKTTAKLRGRADLTSDASNHTRCSQPRSKGLRYCTSRTES